MAMPPQRPLPRHLRGRFPAPIDAQPISVWGESVESFGGANYTEDGEKLFVLFTDDPEQYRVAVSQLTSAPERLVFRRTGRSQAEIDRANRAVQRRLILGDAVHPGVVSVVVTRDGDDWVIEVGIDPYSDRAAAEIRELVAPERLIVTQETAPTEA
jgi:hypothetical protein